MKTFVICSEGLMFYKVTKISLNILILLFLSGFITFLFLGFAGSIVQSDLTETKMIMEQLEHNGMLHTLPEDLSNEVKADIEIFGGSNELTNYLKENEIHIAHMFHLSYWMLALIILTAAVRIGLSRMSTPANTNKALFAK